jgi:hypothetical protein
MCIGPFDKKQEKRGKGEKRERGEAWGEWGGNKERRGEI